MPSDEEQIRILIADDHPVFRRGLRDVLESEPGMEVIGEAKDGAEALAQIRALEPRIALLDAHMPEMSGLEVARAIRDSGLTTAPMILFLCVAKPA